MKLIKTIENIVNESKKNYEEACDKGSKSEVIDNLEKIYYDSLRLMKIHNSIKKK